MAAEVLRVEVAYATVAEQVVIAVSVPAGTTVHEAIILSGIIRSCPDAADTAPVGIYGRIVTPQTLVGDGDRIEIYRPLIADPKQSRRRRAARSG